jgi:dihydrolipoamide dehydrogenase
VKLDLVARTASEEVEAEVVLSAIGSCQPRGRARPGVKPELDRSYLKVGDDYQTSVAGIYAAGDIIGPPGWRTSRPSRRSTRSTGCLATVTPKRVTNFPGCTYCQPQVASTGLTEKAAKEKGLDQGGQVPLHGFGQGRGLGRDRGLREGDHRRRHGRDPTARTSSRQITALWAMALNSA